jgi:hypothetical protein
MIKSESIAKLAIDLVKAQSKMVSPIKDKKNPFFKSTYADINSVLDACIKPLNDNNISVVQPTITKDGKNYVQTILVHSSGEYIGCETEIKTKDINNPQAEGSGITYARRYGLQSLLALGAEDDDGEQATRPPKNKKKNVATTPEYPDRKVFEDFTKSVSDMDRLNKGLEQASKKYPALLQQEPPWFTNAVNQAKDRLKLANLQKEKELAEAVNAIP